MPPRSFPSGLVVVVVVQDFVQDLPNMPIDGFERRLHAFLSGGAPDSTVLPCPIHPVISYPSAHSLVMNIM